MVIGYLIAWTPYSAAALATASHPTFPYNPRLYLSVVLIAKSSYVYNAFIYIVINKKVLQQCEKCLKISSDQFSLFQFKDAFKVTFKFLYWRKTKVEDIPVDSEKNETRAKSSIAV